MRSYKAIINENGPALEACLELPGDSDRHPGVVLCHPHPLYGGDMENNVVISLSRALTAGGMAVLRFNFRGVGKSGGTFDEGRGELDDALAAVLFLARHREVDEVRIGIAGYSFGGMVAMGAGDQSSLVKAIAAVSPMMAPGALSSCLKPKYIIYGAGDTTIPAGAIERGAAAMPDPKVIEAIGGADHFWGGQSEMVGKRAADFFAGIFR